VEVTSTIGIVSLYYSCFAIISNVLIVAQRCLSRAFVAIGATTRSSGETKACRAAAQTSSEAHTFRASSTSNNGGGNSPGRFCSRTGGAERWRPDHPAPSIRRLFEPDGGCRADGTCPDDLSSCCSSPSACSDATLRAARVDDDELMENAPAVVVEQQLGSRPHQQATQTVAQAVTQPPVPQLLPATRVRPTVLLISGTTRRQLELSKGATTTRGGYHDFLAVDFQLRLRIRPFLVLGGEVD